MSLNPTDPSNYNSTKKRVAYTLAAGAVAGSVASSADAAVIYSGVQNINIAHQSSYRLDLDQDGATDVELYNDVVFGGGANFQSLAVFYYPGKAVGFTDAQSFYNYTSALNAGVIIDSAAASTGDAYQTLARASYPNTEFDNSSNAFIGLEFPISGSLHYGWVRVSLDVIAGTFVVHDWAYESDPGVGIEAGATGVPEPGTLGMLAAGAAGLASLRRRKSVA